MTMNPSLLWSKRHTIIAACSLALIYQRPGLKCSNYAKSFPWGCTITGPYAVLGGDYRARVCARKILRFRISMKSAVKVTELVYKHKSELDRYLIRVSSPTVETLFK